MRIPINSSAREATVATHAWTKLRAQIMNWDSGIYVVMHAPLPEVLQPQ